ncbi:unnamed protein product, partial [Scytosiphon promiscuus]
GGPPITNKDVAYDAVDLVGAVLDLQVKAQGGATDNDERRYAELIEATVQGHAQARAKALEVAVKKCLCAILAIHNQTTLFAWVFRYALHSCICSSGDVLRTRYLQ